MARACVCRPCQRARRAARSTPERPSMAPVAAESGTATQAAAPMAVVASAALSRAPKLAGRRVPPFLTSQFRVKLGTMRPPIRASSIAIAPSASRTPRSCGTNPRLAAWSSALASPNSVIMTATGAFFQLRPATTSRQTAKPSMTGNEISTTKAATGPGATAQAMRPASHSVTRPARGQPLSGNRPVQFGIAVSTKPARTACR